MRLGFWLGMPVTLLRTYGLRGLMRRAFHEVRRQSSRFRSRPSRHPVSRYSGAAIYRPLGNWGSLSEHERERHIKRGQRVVEGWYQAYGADWRCLPMGVESWHRHPVTNFEFPIIDWWKVPLMPARSDIKDVWEPARFGWVYDLIRAYSATGDLSYARTFHERLANWIAANPPFRGSHWACGQEVAIRALAVLHAADSLPAAAEAAAAERQITDVLWASGERIEDAIGYGLSQRNNHGISEASGLIHLGLRLHGKHPHSSRWVRLGTKLLNEQIRDQFAPDGWYAQHSFNYMRVALEQALHAERALRCAARPGLSLEALMCLDAAVQMLILLVDSTTGEVPNHGANDGARVVPLSSALYGDFRPLLTLAAVVRGTSLPADIPPDMDTMRWLGGELPAPTAPRVDCVRSGSSGWAISRIGACTVFLRAGSYRHRPSHLDCLNLDIRINGQSIVTDAGTYAYNSSPPWNNGLAIALVHNGPILSDEQLIRRGPRFLWLSWPTARLVAAEHGEGFARLVAERAGAVRREVIVSPCAVHVEDRVLVNGTRNVQVTWLLHPDVADDDLVIVEGAERVRAREGDVIGWYSPTYGSRIASCAIRVRRHLESDAAPIVTTIRSPEKA